MCGACRVTRFFRNVLFAPLGFTLLPWQEQVLRGIYGPVDQETGRRKIRRAYVSASKKQGKSFLIGGIPIYHLTMEDVDHPEAYGAAAAKDQAAIVWRAAARLAEANPLLRQSLKVIPSTRRIVRRDGAGFYTVLSADGDLQDGIEPSVALIDELHRWKTAKAQTLYDVITRGTISRREPLVVEITTAGDVYESPICWSEHEYARQILEGSVRSDRFFAAIWAANEQRIKEDPEYWKSREARVEANPSHEDNGGFLKDEDLQALAEEAIDKPSEQARFCRYHLNIWGQKVDRWMPMDAWQKCGVQLRPLVDRECWIGLDLSKTTDLTALVCLFPDREDESYDVLPFFWLPEDRVHQVQKRVHVDLELWRRQGLLETTPGNVLDYAAVRAKIDWAAETFRLQEICFDPWNATSFVQQLIEGGYRCIEIRQGSKTLSAPMKHLLEKVLMGKMRHGGHELLTWNADCVSVKIDPAGNISPARDRLERDGKRIDGISALVTALARTMVRPRSAWEGGFVLI